MDLDDAKLKTELDDIMKRIDDIMKKVEASEKELRPEFPLETESAEQDPPVTPE